MNTIADQQDRRTTEQKQEALLLAAFRCAGKKDRFKILRAAMKAASKAKCS